MNIAVSTFPFGEAWGKSISLYSLKVETTAVNGRTTDSSFLMLPAEEEYRTEGFEKVIFIGTSSLNSKKPFEEAVNDALSRIVAEKGLKSIKSSQQMIGGILTDTTIMSHEGLIKYPYKASILKQNKEEIMMVRVEAEFSPYSMPSRWGWQRFKKSVSNSLSDMVSVFRQIWD